MKKHAVCEYCEKTMAKGNGDTMRWITNGEGKHFERLRHNREDDPCHDCNVRVGQYHHYGCDNEPCPVCGDQLAFCDCDWVKLLNIKVVKK